MKSLSLLSLPIQLSDIVPCEGILSSALLTRGWLILVSMKNLSEQILPGKHLLSHQTQMLLSLRCCL